MCKFENPQAHISGCLQSEGAREWRTVKDFRTDFLRVPSHGLVFFFFFFFFFFFEKVVLRMPVFSSVTE